MFYLKIMLHSALRRCSSVTSLCSCKVYHTQFFERTNDKPALFSSLQLSQWVEPKACFRHNIGDVFLLRQVGLEMASK